MERKVDESSIERQTFYEILFCLQISGFWSPSSIEGTYQKVLYRLFSIVTYISIILQTVFAFATIITENEDFETLLELWFTRAILLFTLSKGFNILIKRDLFYDYLRNSVLAHRWAIFRDADEESIVEKSKKGELLIFRVWGGSLLLNGIFLVFNPIIGENPDKRLMWESYSPCDRQEPKCFWIWYIHQACTYVLITGLNIAYDCLNYALIERLVNYVKIVQHRLKLLPELVKTGALSTVESELDYLKQCISDHQSISIMANELHELCNITINVHFFLSFTVMCTNVLTLTKLVLFSTEFFSVFIHFICALLQNLFYSWYGYKFQEVTEKIPYTIFAMDWTLLNKDTVKLLRFIMLFGSKPIPLYNNFIVDLSPEMFLKVVKVAYSTFNMIKANK